MKVAILGTGSVGQALAKKILSLDHEIFIGTRNPSNTMENTESDAFGNPPISAWLKATPEVSLVDFKTAVEKGSNLIVFAMSGKHALDCLETVGDSLLNNRVMIDISNPLDFSNGFPPTLSVSNTDSLGEQIQAKYPKLKVVKTLNTMSNPVMVSPSELGSEHTVFMSGNDEDAKVDVAEVLKSFGWNENQIFDLGDITTARGTEMLLPLWLRVFAKVQTPYFNFNLNIKS
ncbi:NADPH-dependent F420 reductase [Nonlabens sp. SY33080]|uniref:NADPH-dependent F420 reductase n=1 Tax=Nonlabens sp. SY33080 TaxID=2719911 RepID=UPI001428BE29|nr:NAD(P)-binding domain-containing protein [Nonlabens sp. SY33080]